MKKGKILIVGLIALLMAGGLVITGCGAKCDGDCVSDSNHSSSCGDDSCNVKSGTYVAAGCNC